MLCYCISTEITVQNRVKERGVKIYKVSIQPETQNSYQKIKKGMRDTMSIASDLLRGHTDTIILARLLDSDNYGYEINKSIQQRTGGSFELKEATLYTAFRRLEQAGCITSYWGDEQTGARRRYYSITETGRGTYTGLIDEWENAKTMIDKLIETEAD